MLCLYFFRIAAFQPRIAGFAARVAAGTISSVIRSASIGIAIAIGGTFMSANAQVANSHSIWQSLPKLPQAIAGQCVGTIGDRLVVAGGSSWTGTPWSGGTKHWTDEVLALAPRSGSWQTLGHLPHAMGYGTAVQDGKDMLCIGGQDAAQVFDSALRLRLDHGNLRVEILPHLPLPVTNATAAVAGGKVYVVGGQHSLNPKDVSRAIWSLALNDPSAGWKEEPAAPWTHARILPVVAACNDDLFVASGADLFLDEKGDPHRTYLKDAWLLKNGSNWQRLPDLPAPVVGAPSQCDGKGSILIFGGDTGEFAEQNFILKDRHPGFSLRTLQFHLRDLQWSAGSPLPVSLVTSGATTWEGKYVIAGGEPKPGHRSDQVIGLLAGGQ